MDPYIALAIFVGSLVSNSIPFVGVPYLLGVGLAVSKMSFWDAVATIVLSALGASVGKVIVYLFGNAFRLKLGSEVKKNLEAFQSLFRKSLFIAIVIFAATPLPDDVLYITLGITRYPLLTYFVAVFIGKVVMTAASCAYLGFTARAIEVVFRRSPLLGIALAIAMVIATAYLVYVVMKVDWVEIAKAFRERGFVGGIVFLLRSVLSVTARIVARLRMVIAKSLGRVPKSR